MATFPIGPGTRRMNLFSQLGQGIGGGIQQGTQSIVDRMKEERARKEREEQLRKQQEFQAAQAEQAQANQRGISDANRLSSETLEGNRLKASRGKEDRARTERSMLFQAERQREADKKREVEEQEANLLLQGFDISSVQVSGNTLQKMLRKDPKMSLTQAIGQLKTTVTGLRAGSPGETGIRATGSVQQDAAGKTTTSVNLPETPVFKSGSGGSSKSAIDSVPRAVREILLNVTNQAKSLLKHERDSAQEEGALHFLNTFGDKGTPADLVKFSNDFARKTDRSNLMKLRTAMTRFVGPMDFSKLTAMEFFDLVQETGDAKMIAEANTINFAPQSAVAADDAEGIANRLDWAEKSVMLSFDTISIRTRQKPGVEDLFNVIGDPPTLKALTDRLRKIAAGKAGEGAFSDFDELRMTRLRVNLRAAKEFILQGLTVYDHALNRFSFDPNAVVREIGN